MMVYLTVVCPLFISHLIVVALYCRCSILAYLAYITMHLSIYTYHSTLYNCII